MRGDRLLTGFVNEAFNPGQGATMPLDPQKALEDALEGLSDALLALATDVTDMGLLNKTNHAIEAVWKAEAAMDDYRKRKESA